MATTHAKASPAARWTKPALISGGVLLAITAIEFSARREVLRGEIAGQCYADHPRNTKAFAAAAPGKLQVYAGGTLHEIDSGFVGEVELTVQRGRLSGHEYVWSVQQVPPRETLKRRLDKAYRELCKKHPQAQPCSTLHKPKNQP